MTKEAEHKIPQSILELEPVGGFLCKDQFSSVLQNQSNVLRQRLGMRKNNIQLAVCVSVLNLQCIYFLPLSFVPCSWQWCRASPVSRDGVQGVLQWKSGFKPNWVCHWCFNFWIVFKHFSLWTEFQQDLSRRGCLENHLWTSFDQQQWPQVLYLYFTFGLSLILYFRKRNVRRKMCTASFKSQETTFQHEGVHLVTWPC